jgi:transposase
VIPQGIRADSKQSLFSTVYMAKKTKDDELSDQEADMRAFNALRRALTTPYKPQSKMKVGRKVKRRKRRPG